MFTKSQSAISAITGQIADFNAKVFAHNQKFASELKPALDPVTGPNQLPKLSAQALDHLKESAALAADGVEQSVANQYKLVQAFLDDLAEHKIEFLAPFVKNAKLAVSASEDFSKKAKQHIKGQA